MVFIYLYFLMIVFSPIVEQIVTTASNDLRDIYRLLQTIGKLNIENEVKEIEWYHNQKN